MTVEAGDVIDRYEVEAALGEGGMASVYRVRHTLLGSLHAMKVLHPELLRSHDLRERFLAEGRIQAQLHHPHIAAVTDLVSAPGVAGLVMEYLQGESLDARLDRGPLSPDEALDLFRPVLDAVAHAHRQGVVHRDLKPANLFLCSRTAGLLRPVVLDFGIAKLTDEARVTAFRSQSTVAGTRMGTPHYMSPEQVRNASSVDARSDVYALGVILYEALTGRMAFDGDGDFEVMQAILGGETEDPGALLPDAAAPVAAVVRQAMAVDPAERFPGADPFREALQEAVWGPRRRLPRAPRPPPDRRRPPAAAAAPAPTTPATPSTPATRPGACLVGVGVRHALDGERILVGALRGNVEPLPRGRTVRYGHALLLHTPDGWAVEAHGRILPVTVDGERVKARRLLAGGEVLMVGTHRFTFETTAG